MTFADGKLEEVLKLADAVEKSVNVPNQVATIEATGSGATQEGETTPVSAVGQGRGTRGRGQRGGNRKPVRVCQRDHAHNTSVMGEKLITV